MEKPECDWQVAGRHLVIREFSLLLACFRSMGVILEYGLSRTARDRLKPNRVVSGNDSLSDRNMAASREDRL